MADSPSKRRFARDPDRVARGPAPRALALALDEADLVGQWKRAARSRLTGGDAGRKQSRLELRFNPAFVLLCAISGVPFGPRGPVLVALGLLTVVLVQEVSGALFLRSLGRPVRVVVFHGGARTENLGSRLTGLEALAFGTLGSLANVVLAALLWRAQRWLPDAPASTVRVLALWHGLWGLGQVLPVLPFQAGVSLQAGLRPSRRFAFAALSATLVLVPGFLLARTFPAMFPLILLAMNGGIHALVVAHRASLDETAGASALARRAEVLLASGEPRQALMLAHGVLPRVHDERLRLRLWKALAWGAIGTNDPFLAHSALCALPASELDVHLVAAYLSTCHRTDEAIAELEAARAFGHRAPETTKLLLELLMRRGDLDRVRVVARADEKLWSRADVALLIAAVPELEMSAGQTEAV